MIGYLQGKVVYSDEKKVIIATASGVGYEVNYGGFATPNAELELFIHQSISENDQSLWGFNNLEEKKMFELLKSVNKVGPSKAYPLVSQVGVENVLSAITFEQVEVLTQAPGIGKKMAEQIILSLKDKVDKLQVFKAQDIAKVPGTAKDAGAKPQIDQGLFQEALQALESLGYKDKQVIGLLSEKIKGSVESSEELIKQVLREL